MSIFKAECICLIFGEHGVHLALRKFLIWKRRTIRYSDSGFGILSVAFLDDPVDIKQFREDRYPMPWLHTRVAQEDDRSIRDLFELTSFPRPILVDEDGIILATDDELRGSKLLDVIAAAHESAR